MTADRFRYLPCDLHPALSVPSWVDSSRLTDGPYILRYMFGDGSPDVVAIDLTHPAGWDHAVRAYVAMDHADDGSPGITPAESSSVAFMRSVDEETSVVTEEWDAVYDFGTGSNNEVTPTMRREALCRCICAALGKDVAEVWP